jgi:Diacylglycerol kinase catalytic domain
VKSVSRARRASAIVALVAVVAVLAIAVAGLVRRPLVLLVAIACLGVAIAAASYAVTRSGMRRLLAVVVAVLALVAPLVLVVAYGRLLQLLLLIALVAITGAATRYGLGRDLRSLKSGPTPGAAIGPATRPVLLLNPKSGGGKVERFHLVEEARRRGIEPIVLAPGDDLRRLAEQAVARGADVLGMAGGDGSQALVAGVAIRHEVAFVCVPAGTRNHLAMDLGLDRDDVVGALDAFGAAVERRIDLGLVDDRVFVNNTAMGPVRQDRAVPRLPRPQGRHRPGPAASAARPRRRAV